MSVVNLGSWYVVKVDGIEQPFLACSFPDPLSVMCLNSDKKLRTIQNSDLMPISKKKLGSILYEPRMSHLTGIQKNNIRKLLEQ